MFYMESTPGSKKESVALDISYGIEQEIQSAQWRRSQVSWLLEQGYPLESITLPAGITKDSSDEEVAQAVRAEYADDDYQEYVVALLQGWGAVSSGFEQIRSNTAFDLKDVYTVALTKYGTGGSYNTKASRVTVKLARANRQGGLAGTVVHEIVHMTIQRLIEKYQVKHWYKERLVDLLVEKYFPGLRKMQMTKEDVSAVDGAFEKMFPDVEAITHAIGETPLRGHQTR